jgi:phosphodiesterase/alkaline phosphatase D-like protein
MKKALSVLLLTFALAGWTVAQTSGTTSTNSNTNDSVSIVGTPSVTTTNNSATIRWKTDKVAATSVKYGTSQGNMDQESRHSGGARDHNVTLDQLEPGTTYYYAIMTEDGQARESGQFTTKGSTSASGGNDNSGSGSGSNETNDSVQIVGTPAVSTTSNSATIRWKTDKVAATSVKYGTSQSNMDQEKKQSGGARDHNVTLASLQPGTTYYFAILDNDGQTRETGQFTTSGSSASGSSSGSNSGSTSASGDDNVNILEGPEEINVTGDSATIWWRTNNVAATDVKYGTDRNNLSERAYEPGGDRQHDVQLSNLEPNTTYYYAIMTRDGQKRSEGEFKTLPENAQGTANRGASSRNVSAGSLNINQGPFVEYVDDDGAVIFWSTTNKSSSIVRYGTDQNNLTQTAQGAWGDKRHRVKITGLQPNTTYYFQVESSPSESGGEVAKSSASTFQTVAPGAEARRYNRRGWTR